MHSGQQVFATGYLTSDNALCNTTRMKGRIVSDVQPGNTVLVCLDLSNTTVKVPLDKLKPTHPKFKLIATFEDHTILFRTDIRSKCSEQRISLLVGSADIVNGKMEYPVEFTGQSSKKLQDLQAYLTNMVGNDTKVRFKLERLPL